MPFRHSNISVVFDTQAVIKRYHVANFLLEVMSVAESHI